MKTSRFSSIISAALAKPGLEGEGATKVEEAPASPTEVTAATPEAGSAEQGKDSEQPASPTEVVTATPENKDGPADNLPTATSDAASSTAEPKVDSSEKVGEVEVTFEDDGEVLAEVVEADAEVERGNDAMAQMQDAASRLAVTETRLEDSLAEGGLEPQAAGFMQDNVQNIAEGLGETIVVPGVESYGGESMRYSSTVASMEAVKEMAGRVATAITAILAKVKAFLKGLIGKLVQYFGTVKMRNEALKKRLGGLGNVATGNDSIDLGTLFGRLAVGDSVSVDAFAKIPALLEDARQFDDKADGVLTADYNNIVDLHTKSLDVDVWAQKMVDFHTSGMGAGLVPKSFHNKIEVSGGEQYRTDVLPGNVVLALTANQFTGDDSSLVQRVSLLMGRGFRFERLQEGEGEKTGEAPTLSVDAMKKVTSITDAILSAGDKIAHQANLDKLTFKDLVLSDQVGEHQARIAKDLAKRYASRLSHAHQASAKTLAYCARVAASFQSYAYKSLETYA